MVQGYEVDRKDKKKGNGGGMVTFVKVGVKYREVKVSEEYESVVIEIRADNHSIRVIHFYNPCKRLNIDIIKI